MTAVKPFPEDERHLYMLLGTLFTRLHVHLEEPGHAGLRKSQLRVLHGVSPDGVSVSVLAERIGMTKQAAGQFVAGLVESGHLAVEPGPRDARVRLVRRTAKGGEAVHGFTAIVRAVEADLSREVGRGRYEEFREVLEELAMGPEDPGQPSER